MLFLLGLVLLIIIIVVATGGGDEKANEAAAKTYAGKSYPDQQKLDICASAAGAVALEGLTVTAEPFKATTDSVGTTKEIVSKWIRR